MENYTTWHWNIHHLKMYLLLKIGWFSTAMLVFSFQEVHDYLKSSPSCGWSPAIIHDFSFKTGHGIFDFWFLTPFKGALSNRLRQAIKPQLLAHLLVMTRRENGHPERSFAHQSTVQRQFLMPLGLWGGPPKTKNQPFTSPSKMLFFWQEASPVTTRFTTCSGSFRHPNLSLPSLATHCYEQLTNPIET